jgi:tRNA pseudouridine38-40 synthase
MKPYRKVKCTVSYDGSNYAGYQTQSNATTIQQLIEEAIERITKEKTTIYASGRTDSGVHAKGQVFHFQTACSIPVPKWPFAINRMLPPDIVVQDAVEVPDSFHSRFDVVEKTYRYCIINRRFSDVFARNYSWHVPQALELQKMRQAAEYLIGEHDFTSFCSFKTVVEDKVRKVYEISFDMEEEGKLWITFRGKGFLYNMVRIMVGTLVKVGIGDWPVEAVPRILAARNRKEAGPTAPPQGLFLWHVKY